MAGIDDSHLFGPSITPRETYGVEMPTNDAQSILIDLSLVAFPMYINYTPILSRIRKAPSGQEEFTQLGHGMRPNQFKLMASITTTSTTFSVDDASILLNGDVLELPTGEHVEIAADPNTTANTIAVTRSMEGTTAAAITVVSGSEPIGYLVQNSRTGAEEFQHGIFPNSWTQKNWVQRAQYPVEISGVLMDTANWVNEMGAPNPLDFGRMHQLMNMMHGYERAFIYGLGESRAVSATKRPKTKGILKRLAEVNNVVTPTTQDAAAYTPEFLFRDLWGQIGGFQDLLVMSPDWRAALAAWKIGIALMDMGTTDFNMRIETFTIPTFGPQAVVFDPQLRSGTALALRNDDLVCRYMRLPSWKPRGSTGDVEKGDLIAAMGIQVNNPELQRAVVGVTGFAAA